MEEEHGGHSKRNKTDDGGRSLALTPYDDAWLLRLPPPRSNLCDERYIFYLDFIERKEKLLRKYKIWVRDQSLRSLELEMPSVRGRQQHIGEFLQKMVCAARIYYMDEVELYFMESDDAGGPRRPCSPRNEIESLSSLFFALNSLSPRSPLQLITVCYLKSQTLRMLTSFVNDKSQLYTDTCLHLHMESDSSMDELMQWGISNGVKSKLRIANVSEGGGKGLVASQDIRIGDVVLEIPQKLVLWDPENEVGRLALQVMKERDNLKSDFHLYFPEELKTGLSFGEDAIDIADDTLLRKKIAVPKMLMEMEFERVRPFIGTSKDTLEAYMQARGLLYSYGIEAFLFDRTRRFCLVPIAQFFNHSLLPHVLSCEWGMESLKFIASRPCMRGQQCYMSYGNFSGAELLAYYGFLPKGTNHHDLILLELESEDTEDAIRYINDWFCNMVKVEESPIDGKKCISTATLKHISDFIATTCDVKEKDEIEKTTFETLMPVLAGFLENYNDIEEKCLNKGNGKWKKPNRYERAASNYIKHDVKLNWDEKLALEYIKLQRDIVCDAISVCRAHLRRFREPKGLFTLDCPMFH